MCQYESYVSVSTLCVSMEPMCQYLHYVSLCVSIYTMCQYIGSICYDYVTRDYSKHNSPVPREYCMNK